MKLERYLIYFILCFFSPVTCSSAEAPNTPAIYLIQGKSALEDENLPEAHSAAITTTLRYHTVAIPALILVATGYPDGTLIYTAAVIALTIGHRTGLSFWITSLATEQIQLGLELEVNRYYRFTDFETLHTQALSSELQPWAENAKYHFSFIKAKYDVPHHNPPITLIELLKSHHPLSYPTSGSAILMILQTYLLNKGPIQNIVIISAQAFLNLAIYSANGEYLEDSLQVFKYDPKRSTFHPINWPWHLQAYLLRSYLILSYAVLSGGHELIKAWLVRRLQNFSPYYTPP